MTDERAGSGLTQRGCEETKAALGATGHGAAASSNTAQISDKETQSLRAENLTTAASVPVDFTQMS